MTTTSISTRLMRWIRVLTVQPLRIAPAICAAALLAGCSNDLAAPGPITDASKLYGMLTLDQHAVNLASVAPYDTVRLTATPRLASGVVLAPLPDSAKVVFTTADIDRVQVSPDGVVHAVAPGVGANVVATLTLGGVTHADTVLVNITATPDTVVTFSIHPVLPDSAQRAVGFAASLPVYATDRSGAAVTGLVVRYTSSDTTIAAFEDPSAGDLTLGRPGQVTISASTMAYGRAMVDTVTFTVGYPIAATVTLSGDSVAPSQVNIGPGGTVSFVNNTGKAADVTFDDPTMVTGGNITSYGTSDTTDTSANTESRSFAASGTYSYHSTATGASGTIVVKER